VTDASSLVDQQTVDRVLATRFGTCVRITTVQPFPHTRVWRCALESVGGAVPPTVIVRLLRDDPARTGMTRLHNERAALEFLEAIGSTLAPRFIADDAATGILISEDLGPCPSLLDLLLGDDPLAARHGLLAFAHSIGTLHAQTAGRAATYAGYRARLRSTVADAEDSSVRVRVLQHWSQVQDAVLRLDLPPPVGVDTDVETVVTSLATPGPLLALSSGDPSPVNCAVAEGRVRFFDFEDASFRHALIDATVLRYLYPTGAPAWSLPATMAGPIEEAYRRALAQACPEVLDDAGYERGMAMACAAWTVVRLGRLARVEAGPDRDPWLLLPPGWNAPVPLRSRRRQLVAIMETCLAAAARARALETLAAWLDRMVEALRVRWPETTEHLPLYPAFQEDPITVSARSRSCGR